MTTKTQKTIKPIDQLIEEIKMNNLGIKEIEILMRKETKKIRDKTQKEAYITNFKNQLSQYAKNYFTY